MKKEYQKPTIEILEFEQEVKASLLNTSGGNTGALFTCNSTDEDVI